MGHVRRQASSGTGSSALRVKHSELLQCTNFNLSHPIKFEGFRFVDTLTMNSTK
jgi:hypothetical protein